MRETVLPETLPALVALQARVADAIAARAAPPIDVEAMGVGELLALHGRVTAALAARDILRGNNPTSGVARWLLRETFGWKEAPPGSVHTAETDMGRRVLIRSRRVTVRDDAAETFSSIPEDGTASFDIFAGVVFGDAYDVRFAVLLSAATAMARLSSGGADARLTIGAARLAGDGARDVTAAVATRFRLLGRSPGEASLREGSADWHDAADPSATESAARLRGRVRGSRRVRRRR